MGWHIAVLLAAIAGVQAGHRDIYGIDLVPTPDLRQVEAEATLEWASSPFGVSVSTTGAHRYELHVSLSNLPPVETLGDYAAYVLWVTTPLMDPLINMGEVTNGTMAMGPVALNQFVVLVSAEAAADVTSRHGRLVLRGRSPSMRIQPDNHLMLPPSRAGSMPHHGAWPHPPMHPSVTMIPGLEDLKPGVKPFLPRVDRGEVVEDAAPRAVVRLKDGQSLDLTAMKVRRTIHGHTYIMYGFNGQYPGPLIDVEQDSTITVNFTNETDLPTAVHWHGVRLDNRFDGVPGVTQDPVLPGERFQYRIYFKDAGIYWYHPHHREDIQQDLGLYGNMLVRAPEPDFWNDVHREEVLMLDDILIQDGELFPFGQERATHALMGRFGNVLLVNGEPDYRLDVSPGEVVRFYLTNVSNTRTFNLSFGDARIKVVGSDLGKFERESWTDAVAIAPAERYVVEVRFDRSTKVSNLVQVLDHSFGNFFGEATELGSVTVSGNESPRVLADRFETLRQNADVVVDIDPYRGLFEGAVDHELLLTLEVEGLPAKVIQRMRADSIYFTPVEWSGTMPMMNFPSTSAEVHWILRDTATGNENMDIDWRFGVGDAVKIRLVNDRDAIHAMQHPFHIHGQRFLVLSRNGTPNDNLVWKDTMLLAVGETADILLEISNPGKWMAHCHIAEHLETGMKLVFTAE